MSDKDFCTHSHWEYINSEEFKAKIRELVEADTWGKDGPMVYVDNDGWIVRHWKDGRIEKLKDTKLNEQGGFNKKTGL